MSRVRISPKTRWFDSSLAPALVLVLVHGVAIANNPFSPYRGMDFLEESRWECARIAQSLFSGHGFASPFGGNSGPTAWVAPIYPWILAGVYKAFGVFTPGAALAIRAVNLAMFAGTGILIYAIADKVFGRHCAVLSAWTWALLPPALMVIPEFFTIPFDASYQLTTWYFALSSFLLSSLMLLTMRLAERTSRRDWIGLGVGFGVAGLTNPSLLAFLPVSIVFLWRRHEKRKAILAAVAICVAIMSPWMVRNSVVFGHPTFVRDNFPAELHAGNCEWCEGLYSSGVYPDLGQNELRRFEQIGEAVYMRTEGEKAVEFLRRNPARFLVLTLKRAIYYWTGPPPATLRRFPAFSEIRNSLYLLTSTLAMIGLWLAFRDRFDVAWLFAGLLLLFPVTYYVTFALQDYRVPIEPALLILGCYALCIVLAPKSGVNTESSVL